MTGNDNLKKVEIFVIDLAKLAVNSNIDKNIIEKGFYRLLAGGSENLRVEVVSKYEKVLDSLLTEEINNNEELIDNLLISTEKLSREKVYVEFDFDDIYFVVAEIINKRSYIGSASMLRKMMAFVQSLSYINAVGISRMHVVNADKIENHILKQIKILQELHVMQLECLIKNN